MDKISHKESITLAEKDTISSDNQVAADTFNNYFKNTVLLKTLFTVTNKNFPEEKTNGFNLNLLDPVEV